MIADMHASPRRRLRPAAILSVAVCAALLAACSTTIAGTPLGSDGAAAPGSTTASGSDDPTHQITEPATPGSTGTASSGASELARFYDQKLDWGGCESFVMTPSDTTAYANPKIQCARMTVPLDYSDPGGTTITIAVVRQQATGDRIGSVVFNPGGPGASGVSIVASLAQYGVDAALADRFDFVGFDPRGVGASEPAIACQSDKQQDANRAKNWPGFMPSSTPADVAAANNTSKAFAADCVKTISQSGVDGKAFLAQVGTTNVAKDVDVLRAALGDRQLTYVGWSYGTSIGTQYAEQFPENVRAMILDGAVDPAVDSATDAMQQTEAFQKAFDDFAAWCAPRQGCPWQSADAANTRFQALAQPLMTKPLALPDGRVLSYLDAVIGVASALYSDTSWPVLEQALTDFSAGRGNALMALADDYNGRDRSGHYNRMLEAFTAIRCMDSDRITDPETVIALNRKLTAAAPFQDNGQPAAAIFDTCTFWPVPPTMTAHTPDPTGLAPVLVVSTTGDPATPYQSGVNLAKDLGGRLLTVQGTRHTGFMLSGLSCVDNAGNDYLINLTLPDDGATCSS
jgi:pimeloyl-ACP methyl ester carboxylesterase/predicted small secreted protein